MVDCLNCQCKSGYHLPAFHKEDLDSVLGYFFWEPKWTNCQACRFFSENFSLLLAVIFSRCLIYCNDISKTLNGEFRFGIKLSKPT
jgi:hypothetical protein